MTDLDRTELDGSETPRRGQGGSDPYCRISIMLRTSSIRFPYCSEVICSKLRINDILWNGPTKKLRIRTASLHGTEPKYCAVLLM